MGVNYRSPSFSYPVPSSSTLIAPSLQFQPFPFLLVVISPSTPPRRFGGTALSPAKLTDSRKSWRRPNTLGPLPTFAKVGVDASHGSHRALVPMLLASMSVKQLHDKSINDTARIAYTTGVCVMTRCLSVPSCALARGGFATEGPGCWEI